MELFESKLNALLVSTFNNILKFEEKSLKQLAPQASVTISEAHMLEAVDNLNGRATIREIASQLQIAPPTATIAVQKLERKGLVSKVPCAEDGRSVRIGLTALGTRINKAHGLFHRRMVKNISGQFTDSEKGVLLAAIDKLSHFFRDKAEAQS